MVLALLTLTFERAHSSEIYKVGCYVLNNKYQMTTNPKDYLEIEFSSDPHSSFAGKLTSKGYETHKVVSLNQESNNAMESNIFEGQHPGFRLELKEVENPKNQMIISSEFNANKPITKEQTSKIKDEVGKIDRFFSWLNSVSFSEKEISALQDHKFAGVMSFTYDNKLTKKPIQCKVISKRPENSNVIVNDQGRNSSLKQNGNESKPIQNPKINKN